MIMNADSSEGKQGAKSVSPKAKPRTVVVELKDSKLVCAECVTKTPKLHRLCNMVRKRTNEKKICDDVLKRVSKIAGGLEDSFLFCCFSAMKILVIPVNSKVYLAFCKNPLPNERHWKEVADRLEIKLGEIEAAFKEVPAFNNEFITDVLSELSAWNISVDEKIETPLRTLADRYDNFAFDVLAYNVLSRSELPYTPVRTGKLKIDLAWEKKGQDVEGKDKAAYIVRTIVKNLGPEADRFEMPIIGVAVSGQEDTVLTLGNCLDSPKVSCLSKLLLTEDETYGEPIDIGIDLRNPACTVRAMLYCSGESPDDKTLHDIANFLEPALCYADGTTREYLGSQLERGKLEALASSLSMYPRFADSPEEMSPSPPDTLVLAFLVHVARSLDSFGARKDDTLEKSRSLVDKGVGFCSRYDRLTPPPDNFLGGRAEAIVRKSLLTSIPLFLPMLKDALVPSLLADSHGLLADSHGLEKLLYNVKLAMKTDPERTAKTLLGKARKGGDFSLGDATGKAVWDSFFAYCKQNYDKKTAVDESIIDSTVEALFEEDAPGLRQYIVDIGAEGLGMFCMAGTLGIVSGFKLGEDIRRKSYRRYIQDRVSSYRDYIHAREGS